MSTQKNSAMTLSYQVSGHLANKFCYGHNVGISASMRNEMVHIKVCCNYFRSEIEKELIGIYGQYFVGKNIKFNCGGQLTQVGQDSDLESELNTLPHSLGAKQAEPNEE